MVIWLSSIVLLFILFFILSSPIAYSKSMPIFLGHLKLNSQKYNQIEVRKPIAVHVGVQCGAIEIFH